MPSHPLTPILGDALKRFVQEEIYPDVDPEKHYQYALARRSYLYWDGFQNVFPSIRNGIVYDFNPIPLPGQSNYYDDPNRNIQGLYDSNLNIVRGQGNKFVAVLANRAPNAKALPLQPDSEILTRRARIASKILMALRRMWDVDEIQRWMAFYAWTFGTYFPLVYWEIDSGKFGTTEVPQYIEAEEIVRYWTCQTCGQFIPQDPHPPRCPRCQGFVFSPTQPMVIPQIQQAGVKSYPNGGPQIQVETIMTVTVPFYSKTLQDASWLWYEHDAHKGRLVEIYQGETLDMIESASGGMPGWGTASQASLLGSTTRDLMATKMGSPLLRRRSRWLYSRFWVPPSTYWLFSKSITAEYQGVTRPVRDILRESFPRGAKWCFIEGKLVDIQAEALTDVWSYGKPGVSPYIYCHPVSYDLIPIADMVNLQHALFEETVQRNIPITLVDPELLDLEALEQRPGVPGEFVPVNPGMGGRLADAVYNVTMAKIEPQVSQWVDNLMSLGEELTGVLPAIFGGDAGSQTAREAELKRNQALMQLSLVWNGMRQAWQGIYANAFRLLQRNGAYALTNFGLTEQDLQELDSIFTPDGQLAGISIQVEESIPATWGQIRDAISFILQGGPPMWQLMGVGDPNNAANVKDALGLSSWTIPGNEARDYLLEEIRGLLQEQAVPGAMGAMMPSRQINTFLVDPGLALAVLKEWLVGDEGRNAKEVNPVGYANVLAATVMVQQAQMQAMMAQAPPPGGPEGGPPGAGPGGPPAGNGSGGNHPGPGGNPPPGPGGPPSSPPGGTPPLPQSEAQTSQFTPPPR